MVKLLSAPPCKEERNRSPCQRATETLTNNSSHLPPQTTPSDALPSNANELLLARAHAPFLGPPLPCQCPQDTDILQGLQTEQHRVRNGAEPRMARGARLYLNHTERRARGLRRHREDTAMTVHIRLRPREPKRKRDERACGLRCARQFVVSRRGEQHGDIERECAVALRAQFARPPDRPGCGGGGTAGPPWRR